MVAKSLAKLLLGGLGGAASTYSDITKSRMESDADLYNALAKLQLANDLEQNSPLFKLQLEEAKAQAADRQMLRDARAKQASLIQDAMSSAEEQRQSILDRNRVIDIAEQDLASKGYGNKIESLFQMPQTPKPDIVHELRQKMAEQGYGRDIQANFMPQTAIPTYRTVEEDYAKVLPEISQLSPEEAEWAQLGELYGPDLAAQVGVDNLQKQGALGFELRKAEELAKAKKRGEQSITSTQIPTMTEWLKVVPFDLRQELIENPTYAQQLYNEFIKTLSPTQSSTQPQSGVIKSSSILGK